MARLPLTAYKETYQRPISNVTIADLYTTYRLATVHFVPDDRRPENRAYSRIAWSWHVRLAKTFALFVAPKTAATSAHSVEVISIIIYVSAAVILMLLFILLLLLIISVHSRLSGAYYCAVL